MDKYNFADIYSAAQFTVDPERMGLRQKSAERFLASATNEDRFGLVRLHLGIQAPAFRDKLVNVFRKDDATFSIVSNDSELTILSTGMLASAIESGHSLTALALVAGSFAGTKRGSISPELPEWAKGKLYEKALNERNQSSRANIVAPKGSDKRVLPEIETWSQAPDFPKLSPVLKTLGAEVELHSRNDALAGKAITSLTQQVRELREELEMLWWNVGGYSLQLEKPYSEVPTSIVPILCGMELAELTRTVVGPAAIGALLTLRLNLEKTESKMTVSDAVESFSAQSITIPNLGDNSLVSDFCPLLASIDLRRSSGVDGSWHNLFKSRVGIEATSELSRIDLAMQAYRECLLAKFGQTT